MDGGKARIRVGVLVTPAAVQDKQVFLDLLARARIRFRLPVRCASAAATYASGETLRGLAERGIGGYLPVVDYAQSSPCFRHAAFTSEREPDSYRCPQGATLRYRGDHAQARVHTYQAPAKAWAAGPRRERCTTNQHGRRLKRPVDEDYRERARELQPTEAYQKALRKRQGWVAPLDGEAKAWHQLRRFLLRGRANVNRQGLLVAPGQNLKRWLAAVRRGHRPTTGAPAAVHRPPGCPS